MCRLAAYLGNEISLSSFLVEPEHSLVKQSWAPKEMLDGTINADGYGLAWLANDNTVCTYKNILPIWSDTNLDGLGRSISSRLWLANVRGATPGQGISEANTQPFVKENIIFTHNGCLRPFSKKEKNTLLESISNEIRTGINGDSDSLYLFALLQQQLLTENSISGAIISMMNELSMICDDSLSASLNIVISDTDSLYACRHALNTDCPSLYFSVGEENIRIASEPLTPEDEWHAIPEHSLINFNKSGLLKQHNL